MDRLRHQKMHEAMKEWKAVILLTSVVVMKLPTQTVATVLLFPFQPILGCSLEENYTTSNWSFSSIITQNTPLCSTFSINFLLLMCFGIRSYIWFPLSRKPVSVVSNLSFLLKPLANTFLKKNVKQLMHRWIKYSIRCFANSAVNIWLQLIQIWWASKVFTSTKFFLVSL